jgi:serpin B
MMISNFNAKSLLVILVTAALMLSACSRSGPDDIEEKAPFKVLKSSQERAASVASAEEISVLAGRNNDFAIRLYQELSDSTGNLIISPYSISLAMAMAYAGAKDETRRQISDVFNFPVSQDELHPLFNALGQTIDSRDKEAKEQDGARLRLDIANQLFAQEGFSILDSFLDILAMYYGSGIGLLDFKGNPDECANLINSWIEEKTEGCIKDVINKGSISPDTRIILVNAIFFYADWEEKFTSSSTSKGEFYPEDKPAVQVDMMHKTSRLSYYSGAECSAVELDYTGGEISMLLVMPENQSISQFESNLSTDGLNEIVSSLDTGKVKLTMPKFKYSSDCMSLKDILTPMGMPTPFSNDADFSGITSEYSLKIGDIFHKAFIEVNEDGTKAAGATVISLSATCTPPDETVEIIFNRPFIYLIRDKVTGTILFMGRISNLQ